MKVGEPLREQVRSIVRKRRSTRRPCSHTRVSLFDTVACNRDQYDRPIFGAVQFCLDYFDPSDEDGVFDSQLVVIHELGVSRGEYSCWFHPLSLLLIFGRLSMH